MIVKTYKNKQKYDLKVRFCGEIDKKQTKYNEITKNIIFTMAYQVEFCYNNVVLPHGKLYDLYRSFNGMIDFCEFKTEDRT